MNTNRLPIKGFDPAAPLPDESRINNAAPAKPMIMPTIFLGNKGSFKKSALKMATIMGVVTISTEALIGVVSDRPHIKVIMLNPTPQKAARAISGISLRVTFLFALVKKEMIQKMAPVKITRYHVSPNGPICCGVTSLAAEKLMA